MTVKQIDEIKDKGAVAIWEVTPVIGGVSSWYVYLKEYDDGYALLRYRPDGRDTREAPKKGKVYGLPPDTIIQAVNDYSYNLAYQKLIWRKDS